MLRQVQLLSKSFEMGDFLVNPNNEAIMRLMLAAVLGALIGIERDVHGRAAGLRTHLLISVGAAMFTLVSEHMAMLPGGNGSSYVGDPGRIAAQVVSGIGFLGAGVIARDGLTIRGLTTAACIWLVASVGLACGAGFYLLAIFGTCFSFLILLFLKHFERSYQKESYRVLCISAAIDTSVEQLVAVIKEANAHVLYYDLERNHKEGTLIARLTVRFIQKGTTDRLANGVMKHVEAAGFALNSIRWQRQ